MVAEDADEGSGSDSSAEENVVEVNYFETVSQFLRERSDMRAMMVENEALCAKEGTSFLGVCTDTGAQNPLGD